MSTRISAFSAPEELLQEVDRVVSEYNSISGISTTRSGYIRSVLEQRIRQEPEILRQLRAISALSQVPLNLSRADNVI